MAADAHGGLVAVGEIGIAGGFRVAGLRLGAFLLREDGGRAERDCGAKQKEASWFWHAVCRFVVL
jgi:hypothetical protein